MRDLYRALILLATDTTLRDAVEDKADIKFDATIPVHPKIPDLRRQPDLQALKDINDIFRAKGLFLGTYALAEINRWIIDGGVKFSKALTKLANALTADLGADLNDQGVREAAGALVSDARLIVAFRGGRNLKDDGFVLSDAQQDKLRASFAVNTGASNAANDILKRGWCTGTCQAAFLIYPEMFHSNF